MSRPGAGLGRVASLQGATAFPLWSSTCNHSVGLMLPPAWGATKITPGSQPSSRKCLMTLRGGLREVEKGPHQLSGRVRQQAAEAPSPNGLVFPGAENGTLLWTPKSLEPFTLEILARNVKVNLSSVLQPRTVVCACKDRSQCLYNQTGWMGNSSLEVSERRRVGGRLPC